MSLDYDAIVVGSGFGGAVCACRLAEAGSKVLVLERGRRWRVQDFPRQLTDPWLWDDHHPEQRYGWFDFRVFPHMSVIQGAGVGGGSLVYANISVDAKRDTFDAGWPPEITLDRLQDHYKTVGRMMNVKPVPANQWPERTKLMKDAANQSGYGGRFRQLDLAVRFDEGWHYGLPDPHNHDKSRMADNGFGEVQGTCVHLGECDIGCPVNARNTLDLNYLALAEKKHHAEIRPLHIVRTVSPVAGGYAVDYNEIVTNTLKPGRATAKVVVIAAGSLGSTELLLRSRGLGLLPNVSGQLGKGWSSNGDFLTPALHFFRDIWPTRGPTITAAIDLLDGAFQHAPIFVEDGGLPDIAAAYLQRLAAEGHLDPRMQLIVASVLPLLTSGAFFRYVMPWFAQARDAADGEFSLVDDHLSLKWDIAQSASTMESVAEIHRRLALLTGGMPLTPVTWTLGHELITPHPLGGCNMGTSAANGVVSHKGNVFGYPGLYVADGAVVPKAIGLNPSKTIAALSEHIAKELVREMT